MSPVITQLIIFVVTWAPLAALAQDDPNADARAQLEQRQQEQSATPVEQPQNLTPNMGIVPGGDFSPPTHQPTVPQPIPMPPPDRTPQNFGGGDGGYRNNRGPRVREETYRNPDLNYRDRKRREDYDRHPRPRYRPPPVIVRPYYPPPVIVRPYIPPPVYAPPYYAPQPWVGPVPAAVVWNLFPPNLYEALSREGRLRHERAFIAALSSDILITQTWRSGNWRGEVTTIDENFYGSSLCRDVVQTIRGPWVERTVDGRVCLKRGQAWRLVSY
jgi:hypothetical protein